MWASRRIDGKKHKVNNEMYVESKRADVPNHRGCYGSLKGNCPECKEYGECLEESMRLSMRNYSEVK